MSDEDCGESSDDVSAASAATAPTGKELLQKEKLSGTCIASTDFGMTFDSSSYPFRRLTRQ